MTLPRLLAYLDDAVAARGDIGTSFTTLAAAGPRLALVARLPHGSVDAVATLASRALESARHTGAQVLVTGRVDVALATRVHGVILRRHDLPLAEVRRLAPALPLIRSIHSLTEAGEAVAAGADGLIAGNIWPTASHPGRPGAGVSLLRSVVNLGIPTWAIGGVTVGRAREAARCGAWGVAAIGALWDAPDPAAAAAELLAAFD